MSSCCRMGPRGISPSAGLVCLALLDPSYIYSTDRGFVGKIERRIVAAVAEKRGISGATGFIRSGVRPRLLCRLSCLHRAVGGSGVVLLLGHAPTVDVPTERRRRWRPERPKRGRGAAESSVATLPSPMRPQLPALPSRMLRQSGYAPVRVFCRRGT